MTTNNYPPRPVVEEKTLRRCYSYILAVSGRLWSLCASEWWGTPSEMICNASSMATAARIFRNTSAVAVYELCNDGYFRLAHGCQLPADNDVPRSFHRYAPPVIRCQNAN